MEKNWEKISGIQIPEVEISVQLYTNRKHTQNTGAKRPEKNFYERTTKINFYTGITGHFKTGNGGRNLEKKILESDFQGGNRVETKGWSSWRWVEEFDFRGEVEELSH